MAIDKTITILGTDLIVENGIKITIEEGEIIITEVVTGIIGPITETTVGPEKGTATEMAIGIVIDQITEGTIAVKDMAIEVKIAVYLGTETTGIGVVPEKVLNLEVVPNTGMKVEGRVEIALEIGKGLNLDLDLLLM